jgi:hypothetical protein
LGLAPSYVVLTTLERVFTTLGRWCHPNFAIPDDKALIVDRQKVELETEPMPVFVLPGATDLDP